MKTRVLVYGDSNTWGSDAQGLRYASRAQWPNILQRLLESDYEVVQEGLPARIAGDHDNVNVHRNGRSGFEIALRSASPFDYLIVALGTNDLKKKYGLTPQQIVDDLVWYKDRAQRYSKTEEDMEQRFQKVIYLNIANYRDNDDFDVETASKVREAMNAGDEIVVELMDLEHSADGLHYSENDHEKVAKRVFEKIKELK
jgi:lysophospholipase L1-like esterase